MHSSIMSRSLQQQSISLSPGRAQVSSDQHKLKPFNFVFVCVPVPVCACMCVVYVRHCVHGAPFNYSSAYRHHCMLYTLCNECSHDIHSSTACLVNVMRGSVFGLMLSNCWPSAILKGWTTCQPASLVESKIYVIWHTHIICRCPLFSTHPT